MVYMPLSDTQREIEMAIRALCYEENPVVTAQEIADYTPFTKRTVLNNIDAVLMEVTDIQDKSVGRSNVYFVNNNRMDEIRSEETEDIVRLSASSDVEYAEFRCASEDSEFDYIVHWYDFRGNELEDYRPSDSEIGEASVGYHTEPVKIKFYDESVLPDMELVEQGETYERYEVVDKDCSSGSGQS